MNEQQSQSRPLRDFISRLGILGELLRYLWSAKMWWMIPLVVMLIVFAVLIVLGSTGSGGSFLYTLF